MPDLPEGIRVRRADEAIERLELLKNSVALIESADGMEALLYRIGMGQRFAIGSAPDWDGVEWFYVQSGRLRLETVGLSLGPGDHLTTEHFRGEPIVLVADADTVFLQVATRPTFHALSERTKELQDLAVQVEAKDGNTRDHCRRIHALSVEVGECLELSRTQLFWLAYGAFLHDLGKVCIPDSILGKPGPLTAEERREVEMHPQIGSEMLRGTYLEPAAAIVLQHHERCDGTGYPSGLSGDEILLEAQIVAAVDAFDAITSDRPYRSARSEGEALRILEENADKQFSRKVVAALRKVIAAHESNAGAIG